MKIYQLVFLISATLMFAANIENIASVHVLGPKGELAKLQSIQKGDPIATEQSEDDVERKTAAQEQDDNEALNLFLTNDVIKESNACCWYTYITCGPTGSRAGEDCLMNDDYSLETCGILCKSIPWCTAFSIQQWQKEPDRRGKCWLEKNCASVKRVTNANHLGCGWWKYNRYTMKRQNCRCLGIPNENGYGDTCGNHESDETPYCYVSKSACTAAGIVWGVSSSTIVGPLVGWSYDVCGFFFFARN